MKFITDTSDATNYDIFFLIDNTGTLISAANPLKISLADAIAGEDFTKNATGRLLITGEDATNPAQLWLINAAGQLAVMTEGQKATFSAAIFGIAPPASATDFWTIQGSNSKVVRITRIWINARATAATAQRLKLLKYTALFTGGTPASVTIVPHDSADTAAALVKTWNGGLPTVGTTLVGALYDSMALWNIAALTTTQPFIPPPTLLFDFTIRNGKGLKLANANEYVSLNLNGASPPSGGVMDITVEWTEE